MCGDGFAEGLLYEATGKERDSNSCRHTQRRNSRVRRLFDTAQRWHRDGKINERLIDKS